MSFARECKSLRRILTRLAHDIHNISAIGKLAMTDANQIDTFMGMYKTLDKVYARFEENWDALAAAYDGQDKREFPEKEDEETYGVAKKLYYDANKYYVILSRRAAQVTATASNPGVSLANMSVLDSSSSSSQLPKLSLPPFDGQILNWPKFKDSFCSMVHDDTSIPDVRKFHYLVRSVTGPASAIVTKLPITADNYPIVWQGLLDAYDRKRLLATAYLNELINFRPTTGKVGAASLQLFLTKVCENVLAFNKLKIPKPDSFILFHLAIKCLDSKTREAFETHCKEDFPTFDALTDFVRNRSLALQLADDNSSEPVYHQQPRPKPTSAHKPKGHNVQPRTTSLLTKKEDGDLQPRAAGSNPKIVCIVCRQNHTILNCQKFTVASAAQRLNYLKSWKGCLNCLAFTHVTDQCKSRWSCRFCAAKHHTLLHIEPEDSKYSSPTTNAVPSSSLSMASTSIHASQVLLGTILIQVKDAYDSFQTIRMVVDSGSQNSFLTSRCVQNLGLDVVPIRRRVCGIGDTAFSGIKGAVECTFKPINSSVKLATEVMVVKRITSDLPNFTLPHDYWKKYTRYPLADPEFWKCRPVDGLLGCDLVPDIWTGEIIQLTETGPKLFSSIFGHVIMGRVPKWSEPESTSSVLISATTADLRFELAKFWEIEEPSSSKILNDPDNEKCEDHFVKTHYRDRSGRYVVSLPFKEERPDLSSSKNRALRCFLNLESRFRRNSDLSQQYADFMQEYIDLGHMSETSSPSKFIIPHHSIAKPGMPSKFRVVFDGSARSSNGSLNDHLWAGPKLQTDIRLLLLNFRIHRVVFVADIVKMYRQINIHPEDQCYQHIYWRFHPDEEVRRFKLHTLTYGLTSSPFQALRVMQQLKEDEGHAFPRAADILCSDRFIDDFVTGAHTLHEALELKSQLTNLLAKGGFALSKWASNRKEILEDTISLTDPVSLIPKDDASVKVLGLQWCPEPDSFSFNIGAPNPVTTKRSMLSTVAKIFDPLGFLSPVVFHAKGFVQELWKSELDWDDPIPPKLQSAWTRLTSELPLLSQIVIPRHVVGHDLGAYQIVGFSDASERGYSGAIYIRAIIDNKVTTHLLTAKSKLAPLKSLSIPRLELCGALLVTHLYASLHDFNRRLPPPSLPPRFFTDSTIVLAWLNTPAFKLKTFVSNRVTQILEVIPAEHWSHVASEENPSDCSSRGLLPGQLVHHSLWWHGPNWLNQSSTTWPAPVDHPLLDLTEMKNQSSQTLIAIDPSRFDTAWMTKFSSYSKLLNFSALILRIIYNHRNRSTPKLGLFTVQDLREAETSCIRAAQKYHFFQGDVASKTPLVMAQYAKLSPFFDEQGVLRVGGRLKNSDLLYTQRHPILLPYNCHLSILVADYYHQLYLHPGPGLLQALIQLKFWVPSLRRLARSRVFQCLRCFRLQARINQPPPMGELPACRVMIGRTFQQTGVDFAGPLLYRESLKRKSPTSKVYISVFVCLTTKAVHLEAVTSLSTEAFLAALDRFIYRRGLPEKMHSDCGTNFQGAASHLKAMEAWFREEAIQAKVHQYCASKGIAWVFIPPHAPHFGGLWEITVKSVKRHLFAVAGTTPLTFEELCTLLVKVESVLNSRPLCPLSSSPDEMDYLTPGHFLVGGHLLANPEPTLCDVADNRLSRWQLVKKMSEHLWKRWRVEYLSFLQQRAKWTKTTGMNLQPGDLVLLQEPNAPPLVWPLAKVIDVHPGKDGQVRVATVQVGGTTFKRPVVKLSPLKPLSIPAFPSQH